MPNLPAESASGSAAAYSTYPERQVNWFQRRYELMLRLMAGQRETTDPERMMLASSEAVGTFLGVDRAGFFEMREDHAHFTVGWTAGRLPLLQGSMPGADIGAAYLKEVQAGRTLGISDARTDPLTADSRFGDIGTVSLIGVPIIRNGRWHAGFYVNHAEPRLWTDDEIRLARDFGEQTWDAVERARAEASRREIAERLAFALEAGGGICACDWDLRNDRVYFNSQFARLYSVDPEKATTGAPAAEILARVHADDRALLNDQIQRALETRGEFNEEYRVVQPDGAVRWVHGRGRVQLDEAGEPARFPGVVIDITDRKRAEEQLRQQWHTFDTALSNTPDFTYTFDLAGRFTYANRALLSLWQKSLEEAVGKNFFDLEYPPDLAERLQRQIQQVIDTREIVRDRTPFAGPTGETRHYEYIFVPVLSADGRVEAVTGSTRDITHLKLDEERDRERQIQLRESARLESLGVMAGGIAHDFNNLLVGILGNASILVDSVQESDQSLARDIVFAAERAAELTRQMLAYSGKGRFVIDVFDLNVLIQENFTLLRSTISRNVTLDLEFGKDKFFIEADRSQIQQVLMNLLINASEAIGDRPGRIAIRTAMTELPEPLFSEHIRDVVSAGRYVVLEVQDDGSGMSPETAKRIFDPFYSTKFLGRGLGLAAVHGIVRGHRGDIELASTPDAGTTFRILLPVSGRPEAKRAGQAAIPPGRATGQIVLVVDDEQIVREAASSALERQGYRVIFAGNGSEALDTLRAEPDISLVVLDLTMPVMTGEQAVPLIKAIRPTVPIILSSGFSETEVVRRFSRAGIAGVLQKPYAAAALISKVADVLRNATPAPDPPG